jgi:signal transduction histidine kinase
MISNATSLAFGLIRDTTAEENAENIRLEERTRLAQELHDTLLQTFQSASLYVGAALHCVQPDLPIRSQLDRTLQIMRQGITEDRNAIQALRSDFYNSDLVLALSRVPGDRQLQTEIDFRVTLTGRRIQLAPEIQHAVYQVERP